jgi:hypothetical protein
VKSKSIFGLKPLDIAIVTLVAIRLLFGVILVHESFFATKAKSPLNLSTTVVAVPGGSTNENTAGNGLVTHRSDDQEPRLPAI